MDKQTDNITYHKKSKPSIMLRWGRDERKKWLEEVICAVGYLLLTILVGLYYQFEKNAADCLYLLLADACCAGSLVLELWILVYLPIVPMAPLSYTYPPRLIAKILLGVAMLFTLFFMVENI